MAGIPTRDATAATRGLLASTSGRRRSTRSEDVGRDYLWRRCYVQKYRRNEEIAIPLGLGITPRIASRLDDVHLVFMHKLTRRFRRLLSDCYHTPSDSIPGTYSGGHFMKFVSELVKLQEMHDEEVPTEEMCRLPRARGTQGACAAVPRRAGHLARVPAGTQVPSHASGARRLAELGPVRAAPWRDGSRTPAGAADADSSAARSRRPHPLRRAQTTFGGRRGSEGRQ